MEKHLALLKVNPHEKLEINDLKISAREEGWDHVDRTLNEWASGENRFSRIEEGLFLASLDGKTVGIAGLNFDPYIDDPTVGRFRHLYVLPEARRHGVGRALLNRCLDLAERSFIRVRLRVVGNAAVPLYLSAGFVPSDEPDATHSLLLAERRSL